MTLWAVITDQFLLKNYLYGQFQPICQAIIDHTTPVTQGQYLIIQIKYSPDILNKISEITIWLQNVPFTIQPALLARSLLLPLFPRTAESTTGSTNRTIRSEAESMGSPYDADARAAGLQNDRLVGQQGNVYQGQQHLMSAVGGQLQFRTSFSVSGRIQQPESSPQQTEHL